MATNIHLQEEDSAAALAAMLSALHESDTLTDHQEMVAEHVLDAAWEDLPERYIEEVEDERIALQARLAELE